MTDDGPTAGAADRMPAADPMPVADPVSPADQPRSGIEVAREALSAARAEAKRRGLSAGLPTRTPGARRRRTDQPRPSGSGPDDRDPQLLGQAIERLVAARGWETDIAVGGAIGRWAAVVGPDLAAHCRADSFDDGELTVVTDTTAWATQVRLLAPSLVQRLNMELGEGTVRLVRVLGPNTPSWRKGPLSVRGRGPRDTYG